MPSCETEASALGEYIPAAGKGTVDKIGMPGVGGAFNTKRNNIEHFEIVPSYEMPLNTYQELLGRMSSLCIP
ncbi:MAG: hypothetical protein IJ717_10530 [Treponema sp.]|nr:hypothetical protein [Treponema sp.]